MKILVLKASAILLAFTFLTACAKKQYRAHSKHYPHDIPNKK